MSILPLTKHVALAVLTTCKVGNVALDAQGDQGEILDRVLARLQSTNQREALAIVDVVSNLVERRTQSGELEVLLGDLMIFETKRCKSSPG